MLRIIFPTMFIFIKNTCTQMTAGHSLLGKVQNMNGVI